MNWSRLRPTKVAVFVVALLVGSLVTTPAANAAITTSNIIAPANPTFLATSVNSLGQATGTFGITGTTSGGTPGADQVDILCYYGPTNSFATVATGVAIGPDGSFSVPSASMNPIWQATNLCRLRAVPAGTTPADPSPFTGPRVTLTGNQQIAVSGGPNDGRVVDYYLFAQQLSAAFDYQSLSSCGVADGYLYWAASAESLSTTFACNAALFDAEQDSPTRSELQIDGVDAYSPLAAAADINPNATGLPAVTETYTFDTATGNVAIHESDPLVKCPVPAYPPNSAKCASFVSAGVTDTRTINQDHDGRMSWVTDVFSSTDGYGHSLDLLWDNSQQFHGTGGDSTQDEYEFPGQSSFSMHSLNDTVSLPATAPGTILISVNENAYGNPATGRGAIVYDRPATGATFTHVGTDYSEFTLHQTGTVPAGGSTRFRFAYAQGQFPEEAAALGQTAAAAFVNTLTVSKAGSGSGTVAVSPGGINCTSTCSATYAFGTSVTLTATPSTGSTFTGWSGACSGTATTCTVTTDDDTSVTATFIVTPETLTVARKGDGGGKVTSRPVGISCGTTCSNSFDYNTVVTLTAKAAKGSSFAGWSGACKGRRACTPLLTAAKSVKATFLKDCVVPKLTGKSLRAAKRALKSHDCSVGKIKHAFSPAVKKGRVITQKPKAGRHLAHGAKVGFVLSS